MNFIFYFLFFIDMAAAVILSIFVNLFVGIVTGAVLLFINSITYYYILKIKKTAKRSE